MRSRLGVFVITVMTVGLVAASAEAQAAESTSNTVEFLAHDVAGLDRLRVRAGWSSGSNPLTWLYIDAKIRSMKAGKKKVRRVRGFVDIYEDGPSYGSSSHAYKYRFNEEKWTALANGRLRMLTATRIYKGSRLVSRRTERSRGTIALKWAGTGEESTGPRVDQGLVPPLCLFWGPWTCVQTRLEHSRAALVSGTVGLEGVGITVNLQAEEAGRMLWEQFLFPYPPPYPPKIESSGKRTSTSHRG